MKKAILISLGLIISIVMMTGCNALQTQNNITISRLNDDTLTMGVNYLVKNLEKGTYELEFQAKEYGYGKLIKEYDLLSTTIKHQDDALKLGIDYNDYLDENSIRMLITDSYHGSEDLDLLKDRNTGMALSVLNEDKEIELSKSIAIGAYSIGGKDNTTESLNIDENYKVSNHNKSDLIIFLKLSKLS